MLDGFAFAHYRYTRGVLPSILGSMLLGPVPSALLFDFMGSCPSVVNW